MLAHFRRTRNLKRYNQIISVLARHGFGSIIESLHIDRYLPVPPAILRQTAHPVHLSPAQHLRSALEELGPTFIKIGQILSTRPDLFPAAFIVELSKLQDHAPCSPWETIRAQLQSEYGRDPDEIFAQIDPQPLGSASLSQVHAARLPDGCAVVIKVQHPGTAQLIEVDLDILSDLAGLAQRTSWGQLYNPVEIVVQFAYTLQNELDYRREGVNADRFRLNFEKEPGLYIPQVYWEYCTPRVLVLERLQGIKLDDLEALEAETYDRAQIAREAFRFLIKEVMQDGFFHADPHPGNFFLMRREIKGQSRAVIGAMDFGMVGHVSKTDRANMIQALFLVGRANSQGIVEHMLRMGAVESEADLRGLERDIDRLMNQYRDLTLRYIPTREVMEELMHLAFRYRIQLPADLWLLFKTLTMMDGLARRLEPDFNMFSAMNDQVTRLMAEMRLPWNWGPSFMTDLEALAYAVKDIPNIGENLLRTLQRGHLPFSINVGGSKETLDRLDRISTRLSVSLLVAAFILGLALLLPASTGNRVAEALVIIGFAAAFFLGLWVMISILRSRS